MPETTATGNVCLSFQSGELIPDQTWNLFSQWVSNHLGATSSNRRVPGWHYDAQVCYTRTFDTEKDFENDTREVVHSFQVAGRLPRSVYRVEAIYWLGPSLQDVELPWHATIDVDSKRNELFPRFGEVVWQIDDDEHSTENLVQERTWRDEPTERRLWAAGRLFYTSKEAWKARDKLFPPKPFKPPKYY